jgi:alkylation response protein AidB-like acyl-CoA dehydrogenase
MPKTIQIEPVLEMEPLRRYIREQILPRAADRDANEEFSLEVITDLHRLGYLVPFLPKSNGGIGANTLDMLWIGREVSYGSRGLACTLAANMLWVLPILAGASEPLRKRVIHELLEEPHIGSFCFTEPDAGSDILRLRTSARRVPGGFVLSGKKCFITNANYASHFVVMARIEGTEDAKRAVNAFYIPAGEKRITVGKPLSKLGFRDSNTSEVFFDQVFVPEEHLLGKPGEGLSIALRSLQRSRTYFIGVAAGLCQRSRDLAEDFLRTRVHYGKPLIELHTIRGQLAQLESEAHAVWLMGCAAACGWDAGETSLLDSSMGKMLAGQVAMRYASAAVELFGGYGLTTEYEISRILRDAKFLEIVEGPNFVQQALIANILFPNRLRENAVKKAA